MRLSGWLAAGRSQFITMTRVTLRRRTANVLRMPATKDERLQIRTAPDTKRLLERAARAEHTNISSFVLGAAVAEASAVLAERPLIALSPAAAAAFDEALSSPPALNERLLAALNRPRSFDWVD